MQTRWLRILYLLVALIASTACMLFTGGRGPLKFEPAALPDARIGVPYEVEIKVTQNVTPVGNFAVDPKTLPPGLELVMLEEVEDTAKLTGIPQQAGTYTFRIDVWCYGTNVSGQVGSQEYTLIVE